MDNRGRLIQEVARELGVPQKQVLEVVSSQTALARKAIQNKEATSVYLRQVGTFISRPIREKMVSLHKAQKLNKVTTIEPEAEEPLWFD